MLAKNEEAIGQLYKAYAEKFVAYEDFWLKLSGEEMGHANWIRGLRSKIEEGSVYLNKDRFKKEAIQKLLDYINGELANLQKQERSLRDALTIALNIEIDLIERKYFEILEEDSLELKDVFSRLLDANKNHRDRVEKVWRENK